MNRPRSLVAFLLLLALPGVSRAGEDYFVLMFGSQRVPSNPRYSHSFATFVKATWEGDDCTTAKIEAFSISWLPQSLEIRLFTLLPEPGVNLDLQTSLHWCQANCMRISLWGPYRICPELYCLARRQADVLESGVVLYKAIDTGRRSDRVSNCIHACSSIVSGYRLRVATPGWGETASYAILQRYERYVIDPGVPHAWVGTALGLDEHPIIYRDWTSPRSGLLGPVFRVLGSERDLRATYGPPAP